jgi:flavin-dependent dehydrogenase
VTAADLRDVLVVGGGPAGSSLALRLARAGFRVALVDRKRFPRAKPCGEFLSPECLPILDELGVLARLERLGAHRVRGMRLYGHGRHATGWFRPVGRSAVPFGAGLAVRRDLLDHELLRAAAACDGVELIEGTACAALQRDGGGAVRGALLAAPGGEVWPLHARWTIGADGIRSRVARELGALRPISWLDKLALTTRYRGVAALDTAEVHLFPRGYFAATAVDDGLFSLNLVLDRSAVRPHRGGWDAFFQQHLEAVPELAERLRGAHRVDRVRGAGPLGFRSCAQAFAGAALVGDACGYVDPITGEGIWFALRGAPEP